MKNVSIWIKFFETKVDFDSFRDQEASSIKQLAGGELYAEPGEFRLLSQIIWLSTSLSHAHYLDQNGRLDRELKGTWKWASLNDQTIPLFCFGGHLRCHF